MSNVLTDLLSGTLEDVGDAVRDNWDAIANPMEVLTRFVQEPITFEFGAAFTAYFQGVALAVASIIIVVNGVKGGYLSGGGNQEMSTGAYIIRSIWPLALIAATPAIVSTLNTLIRSFITDLLPMTASGNSISVMCIELLGVGHEIFGPVLGVVLFAVATYYWITVMFQVVKRMLQLSIYSTIAPLVAALTAADSTSGDFLTLIKEMAGTALITVLQVAAFTAAVSWGATLQAATASIVDIFVLLALLSSCKMLPGWVQRYTLAPVVSRGDGVFKSVTGAARTAGTRIAGALSKGGK